MLDEKPLKEASKNFSNSAIFEISTKSKLDSIDISKDKFDSNLSQNKEEVLRSTEREKIECEEELKDSDDSIHLCSQDFASLFT